MHSKNRKLDKEEQKHFGRKARLIAVLEPVSYTHLAEYLSEVAPDRKQLYQQAKSAMKNQNTNPKCKGIGELTLLSLIHIFRFAVRLW